jgi:hypothetical protein
MQASGVENLFILLLAYYYFHSFSRIYPLVYSHFGHMKMTCLTAKTLQTPTNWPKTADQH